MANDARLCRLQDARVSVLLVLETFSGKAEVAGIVYCIKFRLGGRCLVGTFADLQPHIGDGCFLGLVRIGEDLSPGSILESACRSIVTWSEK